MGMEHPFSNDSPPPDMISTMETIIIRGIRQTPTAVVIHGGAEYDIRRDAHILATHLHLCLEPGALKLLTQTLVQILINQGMWGELVYNNQPSGKQSGERHSPDEPTDES